MLMRTDPFRDGDRLSQAMWGSHGRPAAMPMTAYRDDKTFVVLIDIPGVGPEDIDVTVERNLLTVGAHRSAPPHEAKDRLVEERSYGSFSRELVLGDVLDTDRLTASYDAGVLTIKVPIADQAKTRKVKIHREEEGQQLTA